MNCTINNNICETHSTFNSVNSESVYISLNYNNSSIKHNSKVKQFLELLKEIKINNPLTVKYKFSALNRAACPKT